MFKDAPDYSWVEDAKRTPLDTNGTGTLTWGYAVVCIIIGSAIAACIWRFYL